MRMAHMTRVYLVCDGADGEPELVFTTRELAAEWVAREQARLVARSSMWETMRAYWYEEFELLDELPPPRDA